MLKRKAKEIVKVVTAIIIANMRTTEVNIFNNVSNLANKSLDEKQQSLKEELEKLREEMTKNNEVVVN